MLFLFRFRCRDTLLLPKLPLHLIPLPLLAHGLLFLLLLLLPPHLLHHLLVLCVLFTLLLLPPVFLSFPPCLHGILPLLRLFINSPRVRWIISLNFLTNTSVSCKKLSGVPCNTTICFYNPLFVPLPMPLPLILLLVELLFCSLKPSLLLLLQLLLLVTSSLSLSLLEALQLS